MLNSKLLSLMLAGASLPLGALAQGLTVSGHVQDTTGESVAYATVTVPGSKTMTLTDANGNFKLNVKPGATLRVTYIGYKTATVKADGTVVITLEDNSMLNEAVVIGYGTAKKNDLTGSVTAIKPDDKNHGLQTSAQDMIQGKVAGVSITNTGAGDPNNQASIQIRGVSSRSAGLGPLIVIDGVPGGNLTNINPNDIASFDILKDGAASAIYGTRGSNGVIVVTTKKGTKDGNMHTSYSGMASWDVMKKELKMMNADEYRDVRLRWGDTGVDLGGNYDWLDGVSRTGFTTQHTLSMSGGNAQSNYRVSVDYRNAHGIDLRSKREEYGARASMMHTTKGGLFTLTANVAPRIIYRDQADWSVFKDAIEANPTTPLMDPENPTRYYNFQGQVVGSNPVERQKLEKDHGDTKLLDWDGTVKLNLLPLLMKDGKGNHNLSTQVMFADHQYDNNTYYYTSNAAPEVFLFYLQQFISKQL